MSMPEKWILKENSGRGKLLVDNNNKSNNKGMGNLEVSSNFTLHNSISYDSGTSVIWDYVFSALFGKRSISILRYFMYSIIL